MTESERPRKPTVVATAIDDAGAGVGVAVAGDGKGGDLRVHVPDLLPGEAAEVAIEHRSPHRAEAWGRIVRRVGPASPHRVAPACPAWGACGGCVWQHLDGDAQLVEKGRHVAAALADVPAIAAGEVVIEPVVASPRPLGYRNKGKYVVGVARGRLILGAYAPRTHRLVDTAGCRVVAPVIDDVARATGDAAAAAGLVAYDERAAAGELRYVIVRADATAGALVVLVVTSAARADALAAAASTIAAHPAVRGVVAMRNDRTDGAIVTPDVRVLAGQGALVEDLAGCPVEVGAGEFLQVNRDQSRAIYERVAALALDGLRADGVIAVDLYSGLGGIALTLARRGALVHAIEIDAGATAALARAAAAGGLGARVRVHTGDASEVERAGLVADVVVVNPPRKGLSAATRAALLALAPARIVYVSCGPDALGRDLVALSPAYRPDTVAPYDLMPGTPQVETLVRLQKSPT